MSENHGEPWAAVAGVGSLPGIRDTPGNVVSDRVFNGRARRIAAAVNACAGVPTAALEAGAVADLLGACEKLLAAHEAYMADDSQAYPHGVLEVIGDEIVTAVAKARGTA